MKNFWAADDLMDEERDRELDGICGCGDPINEHHELGGCPHCTCCLGGPDY